MSDPSSRMLALLSLLQARRDWPGAELADRLAVTSRTVRRDVERLRTLGYRITAVRGPVGGYRLEAGAELPPLLFDDEQAVAIAVALQSTAGVDIGDASERALATVRQVMPSHLRHRVDGIRFSRTDRPDDVDPVVLEAVSRAVREQLVLRFDYAGAEPSVRRVEPHGLVARAGRWYLVSWDLDRSNWRIHRLDRLSPRVPAGPRFVPRPVPTGDAATYVDARAKGSSLRDEWPVVGTFEVQLPAVDVAPWIDDGNLESTVDGWCRVTMGSWSWTGLLSQALRFDAPLRALEPPDLAAAATMMAARLRAAGDLT